MKSLFLPSILIVAALSALVVPIAYAFGSDGVLMQDLLTAWVPALALGLGTLLRLGRKDGLPLGLMLGGVVGLALTAFLGATSMRGFGILLPPTTGLAMGLLDGIGRTRFEGFKQGIAFAVPIAFAVGLGLISRQGWTVVIPALLIGLVIGTLIAMRRDPVQGWRGGLKRPPWPLVLIMLLLFVGMGALLRSEFASGQSSQFLGLGPTQAAIVFLVLLVLFAPLVSFSIGSALARWLRPRFEVLGELVRYLEAMYVPVGAFALGYSLILMFFAGIYGSLYRLDPSHFGQPDPAPERLDWIFFALYSAVGTAYSPLLPGSALAHLAVAAQSLLGIGWAVVVFAAVMSHLQPRLAAISERTKSP